MPLINHRFRSDLYFRDAVYILQRTASERARKKCIAIQIHTSQAHTTRTPPTTALETL